MQKRVHVRVAWADSSATRSGSLEVFPLRALLIASQFRLKGFLLHYNGAYLHCQKHCNNQKETLERSLITKKCTAQWSKIGKTVQEVFIFRRDSCTETMNIAQIFANAARNAQPARGGGHLTDAQGFSWWEIRFLFYQKMPTFFLLLPSHILENREMRKCRDRKRVMNGLMPSDSTKSSLLAVMLLICLNLSHRNVAPTWERRIGCNCCLWGAAGSSQPPDMRAVFTGAGGRPSPSCLDLVLVTLSKKPLPDEVPS